MVQPYTLLYYASIYNFLDALLSVSSVEKNWSKKTCAVMKLNPYILVDPFSFYHAT